MFGYRKPRLVEGREPLFDPPDGQKAPVLRDVVLHLDVSPERAAVADRVHREGAPVPARARRSIRTRGVSTIAGVLARPSR